MKRAWFGRLWRCRWARAAAADLLLGRNGAPVLCAGVCRALRAGADSAGVAGRLGGEARAARAGAAAGGARWRLCRSAWALPRRAADAGEEGGHGADGLRGDHEPEAEPTLLDITSLDQGFYLAAGIVPNCRYFADNNLQTQEKRDAIASYLAEGRDAVRRDALCRPPARHTS